MNAVRPRYYAFRATWVDLKKQVMPSFREFTELAHVKAWYIEEDSVITDASWANIANNVIDNVRDWQERVKRGYLSRLLECDAFLPSATRDAKRIRDNGASGLSSAEVDAYLSRPTAIFSMYPPDYRRAQPLPQFYHFYEFVAMLLATCGTPWCGCGGTTHPSLRVEDGSRYTQSRPDGITAVRRRLLKVDLNEEVATYDELCQAEAAQRTDKVSQQ